MTIPQDQKAAALKALRNISDELKRLSNYAFVEPEVCGNLADAIDRVTIKRGDLEKVMEAFQAANYHWDDVTLNKSYKASASAQYNEALKILDDAIYKEV